MDRDTLLVGLVEDAAAHAWREIELPVHHACPQFVPPTENDVLFPFVCNVARWLRDEDATRQFVERVRVLRGKHAFKPAHVWLEITLVGDERCLRVDVSTPNGCDMYLVASDVCIADTKKLGLPTYYRRISICFSDGSDVFLSGEELAIPTLVSPCHDALAKIVFAILDRVEAGEWSVLDETARAMAAMLVPPREEGVVDKWACLYARTLCNSLYDTLHGLFIAEWANLGDLVAVVGHMDGEWATAFGLRKLWTRAFQTPPALSKLYRSNRTQIDFVSRAYLDARETLRKLVADTTKLLAGQTFVEFPPDRTPAQEYLMRMLWDCPAARGPMYKLGKLVEERYPPEVRFMLECVADLVFHTRWGTAEARKRVASEFALLRGGWDPNFGGVARYAFERFFNAAHEYAATPLPLLQLFQKMFDAWEDLDVACILPEPEDDDPPPIELPPAALDVDDKPVATHARLEIYYDLAQNPAVLRIKSSVGDGVAMPEWWPDGELADLKDTKWALYRAPMPRDALVGSVHVFLDAMALTATDEFKTADRVWLTTKLPAIPEGEDAAAWVKQRASFVVAPLIARMTLAEPTWDAWAAYMESVRRAMHVMCCTSASELDQYALACPAGFSVAALDTEMSRVSQWIIYFPEMPHLTYSYLDGMRKRYGAEFGLMHGVHDGCAAMLTCVSIQFQPHEIAIEPSRSGGMRAYDRALADAVHAWRNEEGDAETATVVVPNSVLPNNVIHNSVLRDSVFKRLDKHKCLLSDDHISEDMPALAILIRDSFPMGTVFAIRRSSWVELSFHRDVSHFFELSYTKTLLALREAVRTGGMSYVESGSTTPYMKLSNGYVEDVAAAREKLQMPTIVRPDEWTGESLAFLKGWIRRHLRRAVERSHAALRVSPDRIEFLPTVRLVCSLHSVHFMTTVYLTNALENKAKRNSVFTCASIPVLDRGTMHCTVDLGQEVARWFASRVLATETADGSRVRVAPYTRATGKVYLCSTLSKPVVVGKFVADSTACKFVRGDSVRVDCNNAGYPAAFESLQRAHASTHQKTTYDVMCRASTVPSDSDVHRVLRALAASKFHESFDGLPLYPELADRAGPTEFPACVVREYYENPYVHPHVRKVECTFSLRMLVTALYGKENAFLSTIQ